MGIFETHFPLQFENLSGEPTFLWRISDQNIILHMMLFLKKSLSACFLDDIRNSLAKIGIF